MPPRSYTRIQTQPPPPSYPTPAGLRERYSKAEAVERLRAAPPRTAPIDVLPSSFRVRLALLVAVIAAASVVGAASGVIGFGFARSVGGVVENHGDSGIFIDGTSGFWISAAALIALVAVGSVSFSIGRLDSASVRQTLVDYRRAVEAWRSAFESWVREKAATFDSIGSMIEARDSAFREGYISGRAWLATAYADLASERDSVREFVLQTKPHPGISSAGVLRQSQGEKRAAIVENRLLKMQLASYEEYFPELLDYRELILDEAAKFVEGESIEDIDPVRLYLSAEEYAALSPSERNQHALDRYKSRKKTDWEIGRWYERQIGWMLETDGWKVTYEGALRGFADFGRDLIAERNGAFEIVQCKNWSSSKVIREKHIFQLFGTTVQFRLTRGLPRDTVRAVFCTTTGLSAEASAVAAELGVEVRYEPLGDYPMIKCNVASNGERIYHLPFDQMYDRTVIGNVSGELYAATVAEAEAKGFRRAFRWRPDSADTA